MKLWQNVGGLLYENVCAKFCNFPLRIKKALGIFRMHEAISAEIAPLYDANNLLNRRKCRRFYFAKAAEIAPCKTRCSSVATVIEVFLSY